MSSLGRLWRRLLTSPFPKHVQVLSPAPNYCASLLQSGAAVPAHQLCPGAWRQVGSWRAGGAAAVQPAAQHAVWRTRRSAVAAPHLKVCLKTKDCATYTSSCRAPLRALPPDCAGRGCTLTAPASNAPNVHAHPAFDISDIPLQHGFHVCISYTAAAMCRISVRAWTLWRPTLAHSSLIRPL